MTDFVIFSAVMRKLRSLIQPPWYHADGDGLRACTFDICELHLHLT